MAKLPNGSGSEPRVTKKVKRALEAYLDGEAKTKKEAAALAGITPESFSRALRRPAVHKYIERQVDDRNASIMLLKASRIHEVILDSEHVSDAVKEKVATQVLRSRGILAQDGAVSGAGGLTFLIQTIEHTDGTKETRIGASSVPAVAANALNAAENKGDSE